MFKSHSSENKKHEQEGELKDKEKMIFEDRIQNLRRKGKKRGRKYSFIGIVSSLVIFVFSMVMGYIIFEQISQISRKVSLVSLKNNFQDVIDPDRRCKNSCCLASLEKMRKFKYKEVDEAGKCSEGFEVKRLQCDSSLSWCEPVKVN